MEWLDRVLRRSGRRTPEPDGPPKSDKLTGARQRRRSRPADPEAEGIADLIRAGADRDEVAEIAAGLKANPRAREILDALSRNRDMEVRGFVPSMGVSVLGHDALPLLVRMLRDSDPDNRGIALDTIERLDPEALRKLVPRLRRRLRSLNDAEVLSTGWTLVGLGDQGSIPALQSYLDAFRDYPDQWQRKAASVLLLALEHPEEVAPTIRGHDHERMGWLSHAAVVIGTPECLDALRWGIDHLPDTRCQDLCKYQLAEGLQARGHRSGAINER